MLSPRARRRTPAFLIVTTMLLAALSACSDDAGNGEPGGEGPEGFDAVTVSGELGAEPDVEWNGQMTASEIETRVLITGEGEEVTEGDQVVTQLYIGNGFTQEKAYSTFDNGQQAELVTFTPEELSPVFVAALEGQSFGSRVALTASAEEAFGPSGNAALNIGNLDTVLMVFDILSAVLEEPTGTEQDAPRWVPQVTLDEDLPTALDFANTPAPNKKLRIATLVEGEGPVVEDGQLIVVDYLGQVYDGEAPFDESYSKEPTSFGIGVGNVIKGWDKRLVGVPVGSRVVLQIPPEFGYGEDGNPDAGITGTDTLFFVVDVLAAG